MGRGAGLNGELTCCLLRRDGCPCTSASPSNLSLQRHWSRIPPARPLTGLEAGLPLGLRTRRHLAEKRRR